MKEVNKTIKSLKSMQNSFPIKFSNEFEIIKKEYQLFDQFIILIKLMVSEEYENYEILQK